MAERQRRGRTGERLAALLLRLKGYRILALRFETPVGEIDIIASRAAVLAFVEVKTHRSLGSGLEAVGARQRRRIERAAEWFIKNRPDLARHHVRFDVIAIGALMWPHHLPDAWRP